MEEEVKAKNCGRQNLKKLLAILLIVNLGSALLIGCGNRKISNDIVSIEQFVGLEVSKPEDEEDIQIVNEFEETIWSELLDNCTVKEYSAEELENLIRDLEQQYSYVIRDDGKTASEAIEEIHGMTVEELAKEQLKKKYAVALIAEEEGLILTDSEYEAELEKQAAANGISSAEYESMFGYEKLYEKFQEERVMEFLKDNLKK